MPNRSDLEVTKIRHPLAARLLQVRRVQALTPHLLRITLAGDELRGFQSSSFDDHIKVFFPEPDALHPVLPTMSPDGAQFPADRPRPSARDYTPRRYDPVAGELDIEFVLHGEGPASTWAAQAQPGHYLGVAGPRGSFVIPTGFDWHLLIGDDTALPAIARRLSELPSGTRVTTVLEVADRSSQIQFDTQATLHAVWRYRSESESRSESASEPESGSGGDHTQNLLLQAVRDTDLPPGEGYIWAAGESSAIRAVREHLCSERGVDKKRIRAASYWRKGATAVHESIDD